ncbi:RluA family pseudouridine synthase [Candidatus Omnitrophota bacterium]
MQEYALSVELSDAGKRLDIFLLQACGRRELGLSRTFIQELIRKDRVSLNGSTKVKAHHKVREGDEIRFCVEEKQRMSLEAEEIPLDVRYDDQHLAVINKPIGLVVHPAFGNEKHTLVNALLNRFERLSDVNPGRPGIVHRLDKDTSGLLVIAKNNRAHLKLAKQFAEHSIKRRYIALVEGRVEFDENVIEVPIGRHPRKRKEMAVGFGKNTKYAKTFYRTLKRTPRVSMVELEPFTGRTHQLRVHLAFLGHPVVGDKKYAGKIKFQRMALHAKYIAFKHPESGKTMEFSTVIPPEFERFVEQQNKS